MEYDKDKKEINLNKELSKLDKLVIKFIDIIKKHVDYVIISGYVSILLGRSRATEDVDLFIEKITFEKFLEVYEDLKYNGFWCLNAEKPEEVYNFLKDNMAIRFALEGKSIPNFEVKFPKRAIDQETFSDFIMVNLLKNKIKISSLERQIAFKRYYLKSEKDMEDALHVEELFKDKIDYDKINKFKEIVENINN